MVFRLLNQGIGHKSWSSATISLVPLGHNLHFTPSEGAGLLGTDPSQQCPQETFPVPLHFILVQKKKPQQQGS